MPQFSNVGDFFYLCPVDHILSGFCCEMTARGAYLWTFIYPLFDKGERLHLLYSSRLPGAEGYIDFAKTPRRYLAEEFTRRLDTHLSEARNWMTLERFLGLFDERPALAKHEHAQMVYGYAWALSNRKEEALRHLHDAAIRLTEPYLSDCRMIAEEMKEDFDRAKKHILAFEREMKSKLRISC